MQALAVVELADAGALLSQHGQQSYHVMREEFFNRLKQWLRKDDQYQLLDGDRFCAIFRQLSSRPQLELALAKLGRLFSEPFDLFGSFVNLKVHAGVVMLEDLHFDKPAAIQNAGIALEKARIESATYEVFDEAERTEHVDEAEIVRGLETALERGEFVLFYQPKVHAAYRNVVGAEGLLRWFKCGTEMVLPDTFIPVAERNPVVRPMTWWVLKSAIARAVRWPGNASVAVNVTPILLLNDEVLSVVHDALDMHGFEPQRLIVEVTESIMVEQQGRLLDQLAALRALGVRVSIDDFGTGYSSFSYFRDLPADEIKIDKSFVTPMLTSERDAAIVKSVIDLAHNFSLRVVAEGVEDAATADRLVELGCDILQGYHFDRPLPVEDFERRCNFAR